MTANNTDWDAWGFQHTEVVKSPPWMLRISGLGGLPSLAGDNRDPLELLLEREAKSEEAAIVASALKDPRWRHLGGHSEAWQQAGMDCASADIGG